MTIEGYIQDRVFLPRLREKGVLVVYDPDKRYRELLLGLAGPKIVVIDASTGSIEARENALEALAELGSTKTKREGLVVYTAAEKPEEDEDLQKDPFAIYIACGRVFPDGDGDSFENICLKARPEHAIEVRKVFATNSDPTFAVINQVGGGPGWPQLQSALGTDSATGILFALLAPSTTQQHALKSAGESWAGEAKELFLSCLGMKLVTRGKTWGSLADELWRFLLFSEFVFDLPGQLPGMLASVPMAGAEAQQVVEDLCDRLRNDMRTTAEYVRRAEEVERDLGLPSLCKSIQDLGIRDTFPFEERTFLAQAQDAFLDSNLDRVRAITKQHAGSVWRTKGENQARWNLIDSASALVECCEDLLRDFPASARDMTSLVQYYVGHLRDADRLHREFEHSVEGCLDSGDGLDAVVQHSRRAYRGLANDAQGLFLRFLSEEGWPASGVPANWDTFDQFVCPLLKEKGNRVALILVDALRYELGLELKRQMNDVGVVELEASCAALPTVTPVGMASLLPGASTKLQLKRVDGAVVAHLGDVALKGLQQRMRVLVEQYGQRFQEMRLSDYIKAKKSSLPERVDLLVLRTTEMDTQMEVSSQMSAPVVPTLRKVCTALNQLRDRGFTHVVVATDHGFVLNATAESGDVCTKPPGDWIFIHDRAVLGSGVSDENTLVLKAAKAGIRGDFESFGTPRSLAPYKSGLSYFHGGASLQEAIVPVLRVRLNRALSSDASSVSVTLSYRNGASRITTQLPVIEVLAEVDDIFGLEQTVEVLIEAHDAKGNLVGEARPGGAVNHATGVLHLTPGKKEQVPLKMLRMEEFEGKFTVKAINPATLAQYDEGLKLETDYAG
jgi:hypothetical protein